MPYKQFDGSMSFAELMSLITSSSSFFALLNSGGVSYNAIDYLLGRYSLILTKKDRV